MLCYCFRRNDTDLLNVGFTAWQNRLADEQNESSAKPLKEFNGIYFASVRRYNISPVRQKTTNVSTSSVPKHYLGSSSVTTRQLEVDGLVITISSTRRMSKTLKAPPISTSKGSKKSSFQTVFPHFLEPKARSSSRVQGLVEVVENNAFYG